MIYNIIYVYTENEITKDCKRKWLGILKLQFFRGRARFAQGTAQGSFQQNNFGLVVYSILSMSNDMIGITWIWPLTSMTMLQGMLRISMHCYILLGLTDAYWHVMITARSIIQGTLHTVSFKSRFGSPVPSLPCTIPILHYTTVSLFSKGGATMS